MKLGRGSDDKDALKSGGYGLNIQINTSFVGIRQENPLIVKPGIYLYKSHFDIPRFPDCN